MKFDSLSFTVERQTFTAMTPVGPFVAHEGETVLIVRARSYEHAVKQVLLAFETLNQPEPE